MGSVVNRLQVRGVDICVALGGREGRMAQQFLDSSKIATARQKMGGKTMPHRMRGSRIGQPEQLANFAHLPLCDTRIEALAA